MSSTQCSYTQTKELHLVNIISLAQDKLQTNFQRIFNRLNHHQKQIETNRYLIKSIQQKLSAYHQNFERKINEDVEHSNQMIHNGNIQLQKLKKEFIQLAYKAKDNETTIDFLKTQQESLKLFIDEDSMSRNNEFQRMKQKIRNVQLQIHSINNNISKKQSILQVQKVKQSIIDLNKQISKVSEQQKFVQFKLDKYEITNQKSEKNQINKEISMMRQLEDKIKFELRNAMSSSQRVPLSPVVENIMKTQKTIKQLFQSSQPMKPEVPHQIQNSSLIQKQSQKNNHQNANHYTFPNPIHLQLLLNNINDTLSMFQKKIQHLQNEIKKTNEDLEGNQKIKKSNKVEIQEKINAVKPQLIKLWGKCDAFDDKICFFERKLQQKNKIINHIMQMQKQTQSLRFDEKLKIFQTQIYGGMKQLKVKIDSKYGTSQFEKYAKLVTDKLQMLNDQVILKSDKLQVKKALLFLQSKIKQIILVISEDQENQKDALITKKQVKCISCDKDIDKFLGTASNIKGNWDAFPSKEHSPQVLGRFGMTSFGSLTRKLKRLDNKDIPVLAKKNKESLHLQSKTDFV